MIFVFKCIKLIGYLPQSDQPLKFNDCINLLFYKSSEEYIIYDYKMQDKVGSIWDYRDKAICWVDVLIITLKRHILGTDENCCPVKSHQLTLIRRCCSLAFFWFTKLSSISDMIEIVGTIWRSRDLKW